MKILCIIISVFSVIMVSQLNFVANRIFVCRYGWWLRNLVHQNNVLSIIVALIETAIGTSLKIIQLDWFD